MITFDFSYSELVSCVDYVGYVLVFGNGLLVLAFRILINMI